MPNINDMTSKITYDDEYYVIWLNNDSYLTPKKDIGIIISEEDIEYIKEIYDNLRQNNPQPSPKMRKYLEVLARIYYQWYKSFTKK
jgi:hypothetical protein